MELYLMQHGASLSEDIDQARPLSPTGTDGVAKAARTLKTFGVSLGAIVSTSRLRGRQSAEIMARELDYPLSRLVASEALAPTAKPDAALALLKDHWHIERILFIGHLPHLHHFTSWLACKNGEANIAFENAGLTRVDLTQPLPGQGRIIWHLRPSLYSLFR